MSNSTTHELILHFVFIPKFRAAVLTGDVAIRLDAIIREVCDELHVEILALAIQPDHVHLLIAEPRSLARAKFMQCVKGRSSRFLRLEFPLLVDHAPGALWARDYFVRPVGGGRKSVAQYIENQMHNVSEELS